MPSYAFRTILVVAALALAGPFIVDGVAGAARAQTEPAGRTLRFGPGDIVQAAEGTDAGTSRPVVEVRLSPDAATRFGAFTTAHVGRRLDIRVDGSVLSSPVIPAPITGGSFVLMGTFTAEEARTLAAAIRAGSARVELAVAD